MRQRRLITLVLLLVLAAACGSTLPTKRATLEGLKAPFKWLLVRHGFQSFRKCEAPDVAGQTLFVRKDYPCSSGLLFTPANPRQAKRFAKMPIGKTLKARLPPLSPTELQAHFAQGGASAPPPLTVTPLRIR